MTKSKTKIYCFLASVAKGGMERQMIIIMEQLVARGYDVTLVTFSPRKDMYSYSGKIHRVNLASKSGGKLRSFLNIRKFFKKVVTSNDVIISFGTAINVIALVATLGLKRHIIVGERNLTIKETKWDKLSYMLYKRVDAIVPNSYSQETFLKKRLPMMAYKITAITNYTDVNKFRPMPELLNQESKVIIGVFARILPQKNTLGFVHALKQVVDCGYKGFKVVWYGEKASMDGVVDTYKESVLQLIQVLNLQDYIELHPSVTNVAEKINYCDVFCLPSFREGFSNAISEAICCGKAVLASDVSDNSIMVKEGKNGFLFNPSSEKSMADAIMRFLDLSKEEMEAMGNYSFKHSRTLFNLETFTDKYVEIINKITK